MELRKFSTTIYMNKSMTDFAQIPAEEATINVYRQGATVKVGDIVNNGGGTAVLTVYDTGALEVNDAVQVNTTASASLTVTAISGNAVTVRNDGPLSLLLNGGERLVITSRRPTLYTENSGDPDVDIPGGVIQTSPVGFVEFYLDIPFFDYIASKTGLAPALYQNEESGLIHPPDHYTVTNFPSVATALASIPKGSRLYFPKAGGPYQPPSADGWTIDKSIEIFGDTDDYHEADKGFMPWTSGSAPNGSKNSVVFTIAPTVIGVTEIDGVYIHDITFAQQGGMIPTDTDGTGDHIRIDQRGQIPHGDIRLERVWMAYAGRSAIRSLGTVGVDANYIVNLTLHSVTAQSCVGGDGIRLVQLTGLDFRQLTSVRNGRCGVHLTACGNGNLMMELGTNGKLNTDTSFEGQLVISQCGDLLISGGNYENYHIDTEGNQLTVKNGIVLRNSNGITIISNAMDNSRNPDGAGAYNVGSRGIYIVHDDTEPNALDRYSTGNVIGPNNFADADITVEVENHANVYNNIIYPQNARTTLAVNAPCRVLVPGGRNFAFLADRQDTARRAVGFLLPTVADRTTIHASVVTPGLVIYESGSDHFYGRRAAGTWVQLDN